MGYADKEPLYAVNEAALHRSVKRNARRFRRLIVFFEAAMIAGTVALGAVYVATPLLRGQQYERLVSAAILLGAAAHFAVGIMRRRRREAVFEPSLLGDIDKALWQVRHHMSRARGIRWSFIAPICIAGGIDWLFPPGSGGAGWFYLPFLLLMVLSAWGIEYEVRGCYVPKERKLEALRRMLVESES